MKSESLQIRGNPTTEERCVVVAAVTASESTPSTSEVIEPSSNGTGDQSGTDNQTEPEYKTAKERIIHQRVCPVCNRKYGSKRALEGRKQLSVHTRGTICIGSEGGYFYVHEP